MKKVKNFFAFFWGICITVIMNGCEDPALIQDPSLDAGDDITITLPISDIVLNDVIITYGGNFEGSYAYILIDIKWVMAEGPVQAVIESPSSLETKVTGLTKAGKYIFQLVCTFKNSTKEIVMSDNVKVTVLPDNLFTISPNVYRVQSIKQIENYISAVSFRNGIDSGSVTFTFLSNSAIPFPGSTKDFKVRYLVGAIDEVRVSAVRTTGSNGTVYDCTGTDSVKATVLVNSSGKISIKMPDALAKRLLDPETVHVSADIFEP